MMRFLLSGSSLETSRTTHAGAEPNELGDGQGRIRPIKIVAMNESASGIETPAFLIAMPQVVDPFFHRSVVLLAEHDGHGRGWFKG